jgi:hypothetical protein
MTMLVTHDPQRKPVLHCSGALLMVDVVVAIAKKTCNNKCSAFESSHNGVGKQENCRFYAGVGGEGLWHTIRC